ncbi:MAG: hypothetical protein AAF488_05140, partial [Planctomycetota bacterium]
KKSAMNGGLNLSIADGWWAEAADGTNGWVIGNRTFDTPEQQNDYDAHHLYELLADEVVPLFSQGGGPLSSEWMKRARSAMSSTLHQFSAARMLGEYEKRYYRPSMEDGELFSAHDFSRVRQISEAKERVRAHWRGLRIADVRMSGLEEDRIHAGDPASVWVNVEHPGLSATDLRVELVIGQPDGDDWEAGRVIELAVETESENGSSRVGNYVPERSGERGFGIRVVPAIDGVTGVDLEFPLAKWA